MFLTQVNLCLQRGPNPIVWLARAKANGQCKKYYWSNYSLEYPAFFYSQQFRGRIHSLCQGHDDSPA